MKISSASKKVLASALSAAMVVAFAPATALAAVNNGYVESDVQHHFDAGTVTVAPSCESDGLMTYKCKDGDGYTVISAIKSTEKHVYSPNTTYTDAHGTADANGFVWYQDGTTGEWKAELALKCAGHGAEAPIAATVSKTGTAPTFDAAGKVTYTATAADEYGKTYTSTKVIESDAYSVASGLTAGQVQWTNGYGVARVLITGEAGETQTLTATTTSKPSKGNTAHGTVKNTYTAVFDLPAGILFSGTSAASKYYINTSAITSTATGYTAADKAYIKDGKLVVEASFADEDAKLAHIAATGNTDADGNITAGTFGTDANGAESWTGNGVTVTYTGEGKIADGTARANGVWTIETTCADASCDKVVTAKAFATKVTKASCVKSAKETVSYTIEYDGGKFELKVADISATGEADHHGYVAGNTQWSYDGSDFTATTEYKCPVDGDKYTVTVTTNGDKATGTAVVKHGSDEVKDGSIAIAAAAVEIKSVKATSLAAGTVDVSMTLKRNTGVSESEWTKLVDAIGTPSVSLKGVDPKLAANSYNATSNFVEKSAKAAVMVSGGGIADTKTYDLAAKHVDGTIGYSSTNSKYEILSQGYTVYSADVTLPEGVKKLDGGQVANGKYNDKGEWTYEGVDAAGFVANKSIYQNADGTYTVKYKVTDKVNVICDGVAGEDGFLPTEAAKWTVVDASGDKAATYVATSVATKEIAHTKDNAKEQKAYTVAFGDGKTVVLNATGAKDAHKVSLKTFSFDTANHKIKPVLVCSDCGAEVPAEDITYTGTLKDGDSVKGALLYNRAGGSTENLGTYVFTYGEASSAEFTAAPVFKWTSNVTDAGVVSPSVTATFTSADGKKEVVLSSEKKQIKVELVDAATSTYKATINAESVPAGYKGTLTDTKVVSLHDGHSMVLEKVEKATTAKSGYAQYYCNNDGKAYKVVIAKDDVKVTPSKKTFKYSAIKKAKKTVTVKVANAKGKVSYKSSSKKVTVSKKGVVTVKKGTKKGTYKVTVTSKATDTYAKATKTVKIVVK